MNCITNPDKAHSLFCCCMILQNLCLHCNYFWGVIYYLSLDLDLETISKFGTQSCQLGWGNLGWVANNWSEISSNQKLENLSSNISFYWTEYWKAFWRNVKSKTWELNWTRRCFQLPTVWKSCFKANKLSENNMLKQFYTCLWKTRCEGQSIGLVLGHDVLSSTRRPQGKKFKSLILPPSCCVRDNKIAITSGLRPTLTI